MMNFKKVFVLLALSLSLSACDDKLDITDGKIPAQFLDAAKSIAGNYQGQVERKARSLTLSLDGDKAVVAVSPDMIDPVCQTKVGNLKRVYYTQKDGVTKITSAIFDFDANLCSNTVEGNSLHMDFTDANSFDVSLLDHTQWEQRCDQWTGSPPPYPQPPSTHCHMESVGYYITGRFAR